jgi:opacity protein-like surface antigen
MRKVTMALALVLAAGIAAQAAQAQQTEKAWQFGPQVSWMSQSVGIGVGARAVYGGLGTAVKVPGLRAYGAFDYFFPGSSYGVSPKYWEINAGATYDLNITGMSGFAPYVGAGLNYAHASVSVAGFSASSSNTGLNVLGGGRFKLGQKLNAFAEARLELGGGEAFAATFGILF